MAVVIAARGGQVQVDDVRGGQGDDVREQLRRTVQVGGGTAVTGRRWGRVGLGPHGKDALDGAVGRVTGRDRLRAGGVQPRRTVLGGQADDALGGAQPVQDVNL